jgi:hydroxymethylglutaryl-CoA lyase
VTRGTCAGTYDLVLPEAVNVREVGPRDRLQIERPISPEEKLAMLEALVATGVR